METRRIKIDNKAISSFSRKARSAIVAAALLVIATGPGAAHQEWASGANKSVGMASKPGTSVLTASTSAGSSLAASHFAAGPQAAASSAASSRTANALAENTSGKSTLAPGTSLLAAAKPATATATAASREYTIETIPNVRLQDGRQHVSNPDGIISPDDVARINRMLGALEDSLGIEVAVVAVNSIGDADARSFATDLFNKWGLGKKGKDNGLLIQLVTAPPQRSIVFETGYGLEGVLPDAISYRLQQQAMIPELKAGRYSAAMTDGVSAVTSYLLSHYDPQSPTGGKAPAGAGRQGGFLENFGMGFLLLFFFMFILVAFSFRRRGAQVCPRCGKKALVYTGQRVVSEATATKPAVVEDVYQCKNCGYTDTRNRHSSGRGSSLFPFLLGGMGGFLGGPRGGGGFGGFGGGSWGGGASGGGGSISRF